MPNGHGGVPWMGAPLFFAVIAVLAISLRQRYGWPASAAAVAFAGLAGWRLAYHLHFWDADDYGGAYTSPQEYRRAGLRYYGFAALYALIAMAAMLAIVLW